MKNLYLFIALLFSITGFSTNYYCDPVNGNINDDGSINNPWSSLEQVIFQKTFIGGDTLFLMSGNHGFPKISTSNISNVVIIGYDGETPIITQIAFSSAKNWVLKNVDIHSSSNPPASKPQTHPVFPIDENSLVLIGGSSSNLTFDNCIIYSVDNSDLWTAEDWKSKSWNGLYITSISNNISIINSTLKNVNFAIHMDNQTKNNTVSNVLVDNFCGDGIRLTNGSILEYSTIQDAYRVNGNHDDMLQLFVSENIIIRGNKFISSTEESPLLGHGSQGIGAFDGWFDNIVIENNLLIIDHWHAISLYGARNCKIVNNTVQRNLKGVLNSQPWITIEKKKDGSSGNGNIINNNLTYSIKSTDGSTASNNIVTANNISSHFVDPSFPIFDFHLKSTSTAIDDGLDLDSPSVDLDKYIRTSPVDVGCYEFVTGNNPPVIDQIDDVNMNVGDTKTVEIIATDADGDPIFLSSNNLPSFANFTDNGDGTATIIFKPIDDNDEGDYSDIIIIASDNINSSTMMFSLVVEKGALGVDNNELMRFKLWPNPVAVGEGIYISINNFKSDSNLSLSITDLTGKTVYFDDSIIVDETGKSKLQISNSLNPGIYIVEISGKNGSMKSRIIIK